jgi:hypothetical protein
MRPDIKFVKPPCEVQTKCAQTPHSAAARSPHSNSRPKRQKPNFRLPSRRKTYAVHASNDFQAFPTLRFTRRTPVDYPFPTRRTTRPTRRPTPAPTGSKPPIREPEKNDTKPEDERLMPENEPENCLKMRKRASYCMSRASIARTCPKSPRHFHNFNLQSQNPRPFQLFRFVPLFSVKFFRHCPVSHLEDWQLKRKLARSSP